MDKLLPGVRRGRRRGATASGGVHAAEAIRTTDTVAKTACPAGAGLHRRRHGQGRRHARPGPGHHARVLTTDADLTAQRARRGAARGHRRHLRPDRLRRLHVHQRHRAADGRAAPPASSPTTSDFAAALTEVCADLARQLIATPRAPPRTSRSRSSARRARPTRLDVARSSPATTCSSAPSTARTRTGAGCCPRSAPPTRTSSPRPLDVAINGVWVCRGGAPGDDRSKVDLTGKDITITVDLSAGPAQRDHSHQRPDRGLRARELGVLLMTTLSPAAGRRPPGGRHRQGGHADPGAALARPLPRRHRRGQVRRQRDDRRGAAGLRPGRRLPALRRAAPGRRARRRPADHRALDRPGIESEFTGGLRVTTPEAMDVVRMVLTGQVNGTSSA